MIETLRRLARRTLAVVGITAVSLTAANLGAAQAQAATVTPASATVQEGATQQFTASVPSKWTTTCGSISAAGVFTAPLYPSTTCKVTATASDGSGAASAPVTVVSPIGMSPATPRLAQGSTQILTASMPVNWTAACGAITPAGLYTASAPVGSHCTIEAIAIGSPHYTAYGYATIVAATSSSSGSSGASGSSGSSSSSTPTPFTLSPASASLPEAGTQQFTASAAATYAASCGTITAAGIYTAPMNAGTCTITATPAAGGAALTATVSVTSPLSITPTSASTTQGATQQFNANLPVTWTATCGTISASGLFTASASSGSNCVIRATAIGAHPFTAVATDTITAPAPSSLTISPATPTIAEGATQQFTASSPATWATTCGSISAAGVLTAPLYPSTSCTVTATAIAGSAKASTAATVVSPIVMTPVSAPVAQNGTQQFTASLPVTWKAACGAISASGLFTASANVGSHCTIEGIATTAPHYTVYGYVTVTAPNLTPVSLTPASVTVFEGAAQQFSTNVPATFTTTCGTITAAGLFTAPPVPQTCTVTARAASGSSSATAAVSVLAPLSITPPAATASAGASQQFTANLPVAWTASCGQISASGLFTAPNTAGTCVVTATATGFGGVSAVASVAVSATASLSILPAQVSLAEGGTQQFTASTPVQWSATCGTIDPVAGLYTAPPSPGSCTVTGTATDGSGRTSTAAVTVTSPLTITPSTLNLHALNSATLVASAAATWTASCGSITSAGVFTAPATRGSCTVTATTTAAPSITATATVNVDTVNYTAWKGGGGNTGAQTNELALTPSSVSSGQFGPLWSATLDGWVDAQPLYMNALSINGGTHNVVFAVTANDSVYALDGDTGAVLWQVSLIPPGASAVNATDVGFTSAPQIGILSTPVIDPTTNTMYVVSDTEEQNGTFFPHRLHALDLATGNEKFGGSVLVSNALMSPVHKLQRAALTLANGQVYVGFGSMQDEQPYHGLLFAFDAQTLQENGVFVISPTGTEGGVWMGGAAPSVDSDGNLYVSTGNGTFDGSANFGEAIVKLSPSLQVLDYFAPYQYEQFDAQNIDLGSGDAMIVPDQAGAYPHELIACGKPTSVYLLNRDHLGQVGTSSDNVIQELNQQVGGVPPKGVTEGCYTGPAMWGQNVYFGGKYDTLKMFTLDPSTGLLSSTPTASDSLIFGYPGANPVVSANGSTNGIVWSIDTGTNTLRANDATNVANVLASVRLGFSALRFTVPAVVNGHVYAAGQGTIAAFGLTAPAQTNAAAQASSSAAAKP